MGARAGVTRPPGEIGLLGRMARAAAAAGKKEDGAAKLLPFAGVVALARRTAGGVCLEAVLADLGALLERARGRGEGARPGARGRRRR